MNRYICIHGHFYQPPRENPWLEAIELQDSAAPYHDWNERITAECYAPNTSSRILDDEHRIAKIVNNYARISFNFGPTLLSWMERHDADTYAAILAADEESRRAYSGHGSAIAQPYNHLIMPLASRRDKETQVIWGIRDFEHRFGRQPEGMWLPETAVDLETLDILAEHGILFTILAPHQARAVRLIGERSWTDVTGERVDPSVPYRVSTSGGRSIAVFFYDGPISRGVAFERLLHRGELLADRLVGAFSATRKHAQLSHIATDGETYGHHHRRGDMALAYALDYIERNELATLTNFGEFLERYPPEREAEIFENTSWSCSHGIQRWQAGCSCNSGAPQGWNQRWRGPLREALDWLRETVDPLFEEAGRDALGSHPWRARNHHIDILLDPSAEAIDLFMRRTIREHDDVPARIRALKLLELQRNRMLMYTSCGWFFNDVSGIESQQILRYAGRVVQLAGGLFDLDLEPELLGRLEGAKSNLPLQQDARAVYLRQVRPARIDFPDVAAHYAISSLFRSYPARTPVYCYDVEREDHPVLEAGSATISTGLVRVRSRITAESAAVMFGMLYLGDVKLSGGAKVVRDRAEYERLKEELSDPVLRTDFAAGVRVLDRHFPQLTFSIRSLFRDEQRQILGYIWNSALAEAEAAFRSLHDRYVPLLRLHGDLSVPVPSVLYAAAEADLNLRLRRALESDELPRRQVESLLDQAIHEQISIDHQSLGHTMKISIERLAGQVRENPSDLDLVLRLVGAVELVDRLPFEVDLWKVQNVCYRLLVMSAEDLAGVRPEARGDEWAAALRDLGLRLEFQPALVARFSQASECSPLKDERA
jgi:alpha-amylase/alpha-mannosidase (GH57 family)